MESEFDLSGVMEKIRRAIEHHDELQRATIAWMVEGGYDVMDIVEVDRRTSSYVVRGRRPAPPLRIASIFGDLVHNLRSALDHLAQQLLLVNGAVPMHGMGGTSFPIAKSATSAPKIASRKGNISAEAAAVLHAVQPYQWGGRASTHPLHVLNRLDIIDKHRLLHTAVVRAEGTVVFKPPGDEPVMQLPEDARYPVSLRGTEQQRVAVKPYDLHDNARAGGQWSVKVALAEGGFTPDQPLDGLGAQLAIYVTANVVFRFMDAIGPMRVRDLAEEVIGDGGVAPGSFHDEILKIAARGWGESEFLGQ